MGYGQEKTNRAGNTAGYMFQKNGTAWINP